MGLFQIVNRLITTRAKPSPSNLKANLVFLHYAASTSTSSSFNPVKNSNFLHNSFFSTRNSTGYLSNPRRNPPVFFCSTCYTAVRSFHDISVDILSIDDANGRNLNVGSAQIDKDVEELCRILSNHRTASDIESILNASGIEVTPALVTEVLKRLSNSGVLSFYFFKWAEKQKGFRYSLESYNAMIEALGKIKQFKMIWALVKEMKSRSMLNKDTFALISRRYARARKVKEAIEAFERMEEFGLKPEPSDYNRFIDTLSKSRHVERAQQVFDKWKYIKFKPDIKSYTILLEGWGQEQNLLRLDEVFREMQGDGFEPDVVTYGILINANCKAKRYSIAVDLFHEMEGKNIKPSPHIYCTLINGLGSDKKLSEALQFFELSKANGFTPEIPTYNAVIGSYCWSLRMNDAYKVIEEMRKCGVGPNSRTYDIILHHLIKAGNTEEAYSVFQKMSEIPGCDPSVSTYEIMVRMFCNVERMDMALKVWEQMKSRGILPGMHMFSTLINGLCYENRLDEACKYFQEMLDLGIRAPGQVFSTLKQALLDGGKEDTVTTLSLKLEQLRKVPLFG